MAVRDFLDLLATDPRFRESVVHIETTSRREARYGDLSRPLPKELQSYCDGKGLRLYTHQCAAIEHLRTGENIIITTPTASGKTLAFLLPVFEHLAADPGATALFLYPTKALANDQVKVVRELERESGIRVDAAIYDGDTPAGRRPAIRERSRVILSNPHELHQVLAWHMKWSRFFRNLRFVVIDEAHRYRGVAGSHMAMLLRRLARIADHYGARPQFVLSSATLANPGEFAARLTGEEAIAIGEDGSPAGAKTFVLYNPSTAGGGRSAHSATKDLLLASVESGCRTLCFTVSRRLAELIAIRSGPFPAISAYRAGYLPKDRRAIEDGLKDGSLRGVVTTNALELGIDVGSLDGVIISGYPGTMISVRQQAGRSGRRSGESFAVLVAFENPLDQYFMRHPQAFFSRPCEHAVVDTGNPYILSGHLLCAAAELPVDPERDGRWFGPDLAGMLAAFEQVHLLRKASRGWIYAGKGRAADMVSLDAVSSDTFRVMHGARLLETMDRGQAYREAHPGAILLHRGETYVVTAMDLDQHAIRVEETDTDTYTQPLSTTDVAVVREIRRRDIGGMQVSFGDIKVTQEVVGYTVRHYGRAVSYHRLDLPPLHLETKALWFTLPDRAVEEVVAGGRDLAGGLHGAEHALIAVMPYHVVCDRHDIGGLSTSFHAATGAPTIFVYDGYEGGIGLAEKAFALLPAVAGTAHELVRDCGCTAGCPACIYSPKCGNQNQPLDREAAVSILDDLAGRLSVTGRHPSNP
ncbi:MAG: DEAD/DEAH box helicase [Methanoculleus sp.]|jgi:DEAD/DEAH box helicase domain-containing protein|nr:DEAD/DEAH box helicase [Methanoculleus sp.]